jgi:hypothetical protein
LTYYERHLPRWQPEGAALFVTWRLYGSLPRTARDRQNQPAGESFTTWDRGLNTAASGPRWLENELVAERVVAVLCYGDRQLNLYELRAWVVMGQSCSYLDLSQDFDIEDH